MAVAALSRASCSSRFWWMRWPSWGAARLPGFFGGVRYDRGYCADLVGLMVIAARQGHSTDGPRVAGVRHPAVGGAYLSNRRTRLQRVAAALVKRFQHKDVPEPGAGE